MGFGNYRNYLHVILTKSGSVWYNLVKMMNGKEAR